MKMIYSPEVLQARQLNQPIVALESTIVAHGMPFPQNKDTAMEMAQIIRDQAAVPALVCIMDGAIHIGLGDQDLEAFAQHPNVEKASTRDLPIYLAKRSHAATTVASTMVCAELAGIRVFATGGIGGVHRAAETTMDISADLLELSRTPVAVVSAGAKSILDLQLTLEVLESSSVPVVGYQSDELAAFYLQSSGLKVPHSLDTPQEIAEALKAQDVLRSSAGMLISNPIPSAYALNPVEIDNAIAEAVLAAAKAGVEGKKLTPFLLEYIANLTKGRSLEANIALAKNNAFLGAQIAVAYSALS